MQSIEQVGLENEVSIGRLISCTAIFYECCVDTIGIGITLVQEDIACKHGCEGKADDEHFQRELAGIESACCSI